MGPGVVGEAGAVLGDRLSLDLRLSLMTIAVVWSLGVDDALSDHFTLGAGVGTTLLGGLDAPCSVT